MASSLLTEIFVSAVPKKSNHENTEYEKHEIFNNLFRDFVINAISG